MNKLKKQEGFTLIEMLIVVAIIAILVAVSIPLIGNALEKTRRATDVANERAAKAEILIQYMTDTTFDTSKVYVYDAVKGELSETNPADSYGQCTSDGDGCKDRFLYIKLDPTTTAVTMQWATTMPDGSAMTTAADNSHLQGTKTRP